MIISSGRSKYFCAIWSTNVISTYIFKHLCHGFHSFICEHISHDWPSPTSMLSPSCHKSNLYSICTGILMVHRYKWIQVFLYHLEHFNVHWPCSLLLLDPAFIHFILHGSSLFFCFNHWVTSIVILFHTCLRVLSHTLLEVAVLWLYILSQPILLLTISSLPINNKHGHILSFFYVYNCASHYV